MMTPERIHQALAASGRAVACLVRTLPEELARFRSRPDQWSPLEIVNHLADMEEERFRAHLVRLLGTIPQVPGASQPATRATERAYQDRNLEESLERFLDQRAASLSLIKSLPADQDLGRTTEGGHLKLGQLLCSWVDHDLAHVAQITRGLTLAYQKAFEPWTPGAWNSTSATIE